MHYIHTANHKDNANMTIPGEHVMCWKTVEELTKSIYTNFLNKSRFSLYHLQRSLYSDTNATIIC